MPARWFRISYARNAFLRSLEDQSLTLDTMTVAQASRAILRFRDTFRPQHGDTDKLLCEWGPALDGGAGWWFAIARRMTRAGHPTVRLRVALELAPRAGDPAGVETVVTIADVRATEGYRRAAGRAIRTRIVEQVAES